MITAFKKVRTLGFTLIELLVVIAIIAILAAILIPAVNSALLKGAMARTAADGRSIYISLFAKDLDNAAQVSASTVAFPQGTTFANSTDFFKYVITNKLMTVPFAFFAAKGVPAASNDVAQFSAANNAWNVTKDINDSTPDGAPVLFTRNLVIAKTREDTTATFPNKMNVTNTPFGNKGVVVVGKGGNAFYLLGDQIVYSNFNPPDATNDVLNP